MVTPKCCESAVHGLVRYSSDRHKLLWTCAGLVFSILVAFLMPLAVSGELSYHAAATTCWAKRDKYERTVWEAQPHDKSKLFISSASWSWWFHVWFVVIKHCRCGHKGAKYSFPI